MVGTELREHNPDRRGWQTLKRPFPVNWFISQSTFWVFCLDRKLPFCLISWTQVWCIDFRNKCFCWIKWLKKETFKAENTTLWNCSVRNSWSRIQCWKWDTPASWTKYHVTDCGNFLVRKNTGKRNNGVSWWKLHMPLLADAGSQIFSSSIALYKVHCVTTFILLMDAFFSFRIADFMALLFAKASVLMCIETKLHLERTWFKTMGQYFVFLFFVRARSIGYSRQKWTRSTRWS